LHCNSDNYQDDVYGAVIMAQSYCKSSLGSFDECRLSEKIKWVEFKTRVKDARLSTVHYARISLKLDYSD